MRRLNFISVLLLFSALFVSVKASAACKNWVAKLVSVDGKVDVQTYTGSTWDKVVPNQLFCRGDIVRAAKHSRATFRLQNDAVLSLDQSTTLSFLPLEEENSPWWVQLLDGSIFVRSRAAQKLRVNTPFINAVHKGTEFMVTVNKRQTEISVFDGAVQAENSAGQVQIASGQVGIAQEHQKPVVQALTIKPVDAVQWALYYPAIIDHSQNSIAQKVLQNLAQDDYSNALERLATLPESQRTHDYWSVKASLLLAVGRVDEAQQALGHIPENSSALALSAIIAVAQNQQKQALELAQQSVARDPHSATAHIALSYAYQSLFKITDALHAADQATQLAPENALAWSRLSELQLSQGERDAAIRSAAHAQQLNPTLAHTQMTLGFAKLAQVETHAAQTDFERAIRLNASDPLAWLGLALAKIHRGQLDEGIKDLETAVNLDPNNAIMRSYLGKAYYEKRNKDYAGTEFKIAKAMDPNDPTPWFYDAILKQTTNRPVDALQDMQKAIALNDNRAVYRSRLLLDDDLAARSTAVARIYQDIGFNQRALLEGWQTLSNNRTDYSGHRLLADGYSALPGHELARTSELLQSQLFQPINITPIQPHLGERNLAILSGSGPASNGFNEFNPLFSKNGFSLQTSGVVGSLDTYGDEVVHSGLWDKFSYSLGQFHHQTKGFRDNNDIDQNIYNAFVQGEPYEGINLQAEYRHRDVTHGDLFYYGDLSKYSPNFSRTLNTDTYRFGATLTPTVHSKIVSSITFLDHFDNGLNVQEGVNQYQKTQRGVLGEAQYNYKRDRYGLSLGGSAYDMTNTTIFGLDPSILELESLAPYHKRFNTSYGNFYVYNFINFPQKVTWTLGLSVDSISNAINGNYSKTQIDPKLGILWQFNDKTTFRFAAFRTLSRGLWVDSTIEPTQVAGFNQLYDSWPVTSAWRYGVGIDHKVSHSVLVGAEASKRDLVQPTMSVDFSENLDIILSAYNIPWQDKYLRAYAYWTINQYLTSTLEYQYDTIASKGFSWYKNHIIPFSVRYFDQTYGFNAAATLTYVNQNAVDPTNESISSDSSFALLDLAMGYRIPNRWGILKMQVKNVLDKRFNFVGQSLAGQRNDRFEETPLFIPDRTFYMNFTLSF